MFAKRYDSCTVRLTLAYLALNTANSTTDELLSCRQYEIERLVDLDGVCSHRVSLAKIGPGNISRLQVSGDHDPGSGRDRSWDIIYHPSVHIIAAPVFFSLSKELCDSFSAGLDLRIMARVVLSDG